MVANGGTLDVESGGVADPTVILSGGTENVSAGGTDSGAHISGGAQLVFGSATGDDRIHRLAGDRIGRHRS